MSFNTREPLVAHGRVRHQSLKPDMEEPRRSTYAGIRELDVRGVRAGDAPLGTVSHSASHRMIQLWSVTREHALVLCDRRSGSHELDRWLSDSARG